MRKVRISSSDVEAAKFPVTVRGYAEDEVDAFLDMVTETIGEYEQRDARAHEEIERLRSALDECRDARIGERATSESLKDRYGEIETRIHDLLEEATRTSERVVEEALEAGEHILDQIRTVMTASSASAEGEDAEIPAAATQDAGSASMD